MYFDLISGASLLDQYTNVTPHPEIWAFYQAHMIIHQSLAIEYYCQTATVEQMCGHSPRYAEPYTYKWIAVLLPSLNDVDLASLNLISTNQGNYFLDKSKGINMHLINNRPTLSDM